MKRLNLYFLTGLLFLIIYPSVHASSTTIGGGGLAWGNVSSLNFTEDLGDGYLKPAPGGMGVYDNFNDLNLNGWTITGSADASLGYLNITSASSRVSIPFAINFTQGIAFNFSYWHQNMSSGLNPNIYYLTNSSGANPINYLLNQLLWSNWRVRRTGAVNICAGSGTSWQPYLESNGHEYRLSNNGSGGHAWRIDDNLICSGDYIVPSDEIGAYLNLQGGSVAGEKKFDNVSYTPFAAGHSNITVNGSFLGLNNYLLNASWQGSFNGSSHSVSIVFWNSTDTDIVLNTVPGTIYNSTKNFQANLSYVNVSLNYNNTVPSSNIPIIYNVTVYNASIGGESDTTLPAFTYPQTNGTTVGVTVGINTTITEVNPDKWWFETNNTGALVNSSLNSYVNGQTVVANVTLNSTVGVGVQIRFWANDTSSNINQSSTLTIITTVAGDVTPPNNVSFISPTPANNTVVQANYAYINVSVEDAVGVDSALLEWNSTNQSMTKVGSGTTVTFNVNKTGLSNATTYAFRVWANDTSGNWNVSESRWVSTNLAYNVRYVAPFGNNNSDGLTIATAWKTPNRAIQAADAGNISSGDIVYIIGGSYVNEGGTPFFNFALATNKDWRPNYLTFQTLPNNGTAVFDGNGVLDSGVVMFQENISYVKMIGPMEFFNNVDSAIHSGGVSDSNSGSNQYFEGMILHNNTDVANGIFQGGHFRNLTIRNSEIYGHGHNGMGFGGGNGQSTWNLGGILEYSYVHEVGTPAPNFHGNGIQMPNTYGTIVRYVQTRGNLESEIYLSSGASVGGANSSNIYGNYLNGVDNGSSGIKDQEGTYDNWVHDNIVLYTLEGFELASSGSKSSQRERFQNNHIQWCAGAACLAVYNSSFSNLTGNIVKNGTTANIRVWSDADNIKIIDPPDASTNFTITIVGGESVDINMTGIGELSTNGGASWVTSVTITSTTNIQVRNSTSSLPIDIYVRAMVDANTPISGATVTLNTTLSNTTNATGYAIFNNIVPGPHYLKIVTPSNGEFWGPGRLTPWRNTTAEPLTQMMISSTLGGSAYPITIVFGNPTLPAAGDTTPPSNVSFSPPTQANNSVVGNYVFVNVTVGDETGVDSALLEWNGTNESMTKVGSGTNVTFNVNKTGLLNASTYVSKVWANDTSGNWNSSETRQVSTSFADTTPPTISLISPSDLNVSVARNWTYVNITSNEALSTAILQWNGTNYTTTSANSTNWYLNRSDANGNYTYSVWVNDSSGNVNISPNYWVYFDNVMPLISWGAGTLNDGVTVTQSNVYLNTSWTENNPSTITFWVDGISHINTIPPNVYADNYTGLSDGVKIYYVVLCDLANNCNQTSTRTITLDINPPQLFSNASNTTYSNPNLTFQINASNPNLQYIWHDLNGTGNGSLQSGNYSLSYIFIDGNYNLTIYANDSAGNFNQTTIYFTVDTTVSTPIGGGGGGFYEQPLKILTEEIKSITSAQGKYNLFKIAGVLAVISGVIFYKYGLLSKRRFKKFKNNIKDQLKEDDKYGF